MKYLLIIFFLLFLTNCSLNKDSQYWTEHPAENKKNQKKINEILKKSEDITKMTLEEWRVLSRCYLQITLTKVLLT